MLEKEILHFKIGLSGSSDKKHPEFQISVNERECVGRRQLTAGANETEYFEFDVEIEQGNHSLTIELLNKSIYDTVIDTNNNIVEDLLLNIDSIEIDEIDLGSLLWTSSEYLPFYPEKYKLTQTNLGKELPELIKNCVNLGWNGKWNLAFSSPFYIWLLENL